MLTTGLVGFTEEEFRQTYGDDPKILMRLQLRMYQLVDAQDRNGRPCFLSSLTPGGDVWMAEYAIQQKRAVPWIDRIKVFIVTPFAKDNITITEQYVINNASGYVNAKTPFKALVDHSSCILAVTFNKNHPVFAYAAEAGREVLWYTPDELLQSTPQDRAHDYGRTVTVIKQQVGRG